ncbi:erythromycin esterase family protein [Streptomyces zingiberis]|uniref:Erythromycin esterase family protein n=1 Tax=Streptomyces zingiberis TaxID=2053010 RepID=A0ABX1BNN1_9ACTN|nr:erythromycin esterase family protein [Streptomyces zingiberis]NJP99338.1 erythromycin esterase family protein [Streptomyces zingiberis]
MTSRRIAALSAALLVSAGALTAALPLEHSATLATARAAVSTAVSGTGATGNAGAPGGTAVPVAQGGSARSATDGDERALRSFRNGAHPLRTTEPRGSTADLRPLGRMVQGSTVVGLGEATHGSRDFFTMKHRVFRYLVAEQGFRAFALEASWSTGLRLDAYVTRGEGELGKIMDEEFQETYSIWNKKEYHDLFTWMRAYNRSHPKDPVRVVGDDMAYAGPALFDEVIAYVERAHPRLLPRFTELYRGLRPTGPVGDTLARFPDTPLAERKEHAERTGRALELLSRQSVRPGADRGAHRWAVQQARAIDQTYRGYAFDLTDPAGIAAMMKNRDRVMAENVAWWQRTTGDRILLSAHNTHVAYDSFDTSYPKTQGAFLRDTLGKRYVSLGFTFNQGSFRAFSAEEGPGSGERTVTIGAAAPGSNEHLLDQVGRAGQVGRPGKPGEQADGSGKAGPRDYFLDVRALSAAGRSWLNEPRPTRNIGAGWPVPEQDIALGGAHDILIHLHEVGAATPRTAP